MFIGSADTIRTGDVSVGEVIRDISSDEGSMGMERGFVYILAVVYSDWIYVMFMLWSVIMFYRVILQ